MIKTIFFLLIFVIKDTMLLSVDQIQSDYDLLFSHFSGLLKPNQLPKELNFGGIAEVTFKKSIQEYEKTATKKVELDHFNSESHHDDVKNIIDILHDKNSDEDTKKNLLLRSHITSSGSTLKITPKTKYNLPMTAHATSRASNSSFVRNQKDIKTPKELFKDDQELSILYKNFIDLLNKNPDFLAYFKKMHILLLHQIYIYLIGVYTTLNMTHIDDLKTYVSLESRYGLNKKTLIINHLVNVIQEQLSKALTALFPNTPQEYSIKIGMASLGQDYGTNLNFMLLDMEQYVLSLFGINSLTDHQCSIVCDLLTSDENRQFLLSIDQLLIKSVIAKMHKHSTNFSKELTVQEKDTFIKACDLLIVKFNETEQEKNLSSLMFFLSGKVKDPVSKKSMNLLISIIAHCGFAFPLDKEIEISAEIEKKLNDKSDLKPLSDQEFRCLQSIVSFVIYKYEEKTMEAIDILIDNLNKLNPEMMALSIDEKIKLHKISIYILDQKSDFYSLSQDDKQVLAKGVSAFKSQNKQIASSDLFALDQIIEKLSNNTFHTALASADQLRLLNSLLLQYKSFSPIAITQDQVENQISDDQKKELENLGSLMVDPSVQSLEGLKKTDQILLLSTLEKVEEVLRTQMNQHKVLASSLSDFFQNDKKTLDIIFKSISSEQYETLKELDHQINEELYGSSLKADQLKSGFSFSKLTDKERSSLLKIFSTSTSKTEPNNYASLLIEKRKSQKENTAFELVFKLISDDQRRGLVSVFQKTLADKFSIEDLSKDEKTLMIDVCNAYSKSLLDQSIEYQDNDQDFDDPQENTLKTIRNVVNDSMHLSSKQDGYLQTLNAYLLFFEKYTATLYLNDTSRNYVGLTKFLSHAQIIANELKDTKLHDSNPPLFFYDKHTLRGIKLLPKLAKEIEKTEHAPYPTFGASLACFGSCKNISTGQVEENQISIGQGQTIMPGSPKFFFKDKDGKEFFNSIAPWIEKVEVDHQDEDSFNYIFKHKRSPVLQEGFFMNIPMVFQDPGSPKGVATIRLYEQPIFAQPDWLNSTQGVINMLSGCLGSFSSLLDFDIFDPCMTFILKKGLLCSKKITSDQKEDLEKQLQKSKEFMKSQAAQIEAKSGSEPSKIES